MGDTGHFEPQSRARRRSLQAIYLWHINPQEAAAVLAQFRDEQDFSNVDTGLFEALVRGVIEDHQRLEEQLAEFVDRPGEQLDVMERAILQLGAWELLNRPGTPLKVILHEAVELARRFGAEQSHTFVNAVLDRAARQWRVPQDGAEDGVNTGTEAGTQANTPNGDTRDSG